MAKHKVLWVEHNGKKGAKTFDSSLGRATVESYRKRKAAEASVKMAWIQWGSLPQTRRRGN